MAPDGVPCEFRGFLRKLAKPSNHDETAKQRITSSKHAIWRLSHGDSRPSMKNGESPANHAPHGPGARCTRAALGAWRPNVGGRNVLRPSGRQAHPQHEEYPNLRPVNTERAEVRRHGGFLELAYAHLNHAACNLHGLGCDKHSPPVSSQNSTDSPIYGGARLSRPQSRWFCKCLCMVKRGRIVRSTFFSSLFCVARRAFPCVPW